MGTFNTTVRQLSKGPGKENTFQVSKVTQFHFYSPRDSLI